MHSLGVIIELISVSPVMSHFLSPAFSAVVTGSQRVYYSLSFTVSFVSIIHFGAMMMCITGNIPLLFVGDIIQSGMECDVCVTKLVLWPTLQPLIILLLATWVINSQSRGAVLVCHAVLKEAVGLGL